MRSLFTGKKNTHTSRFHLLHMLLLLHDLYGAVIIYMSPEEWNINALALHERTSRTHSHGPPRQPISPTLFPLSPQIFWPDKTLVCVCESVYAGMHVNNFLFYWFSGYHNQSFNDPSLHTHHPG